MKAPLAYKIHLVLFTIVHLTLAGLLGSCSHPQPDKKVLPILGERRTVQKLHHGKKVTETVDHQIPPFRFMNQDSLAVTDKTFAQKIYVSDFIFTSCPTICPKMKTQMQRVYEHFKDNNQVLLLSHTLDPQHDSVAVLREFAQRLGVSSKKWHFVTGAPDSLYAMAAHYLVTTGQENGKAAGLVHSAAFVLVDTDRHIRGIYDGTQPAQVDRLLADIQVLIAGKKQTYLSH